MRAVLSLMLSVLAAVAAARDAAPASRLVQRATATTEVLDIDANGTTDALTDGLVTLRYLFSMRGDPLIGGVVGSGALRATAPDIESYLAGLVTGAPATLDIDGDGQVGALTDGLIIVRYLFGIRGATLVSGALGAGATRTTSGDVETYMATLTASQPHPPTGCSVVAQPVSSAGAPLAPGTSVQLTANCTGGQQPITYDWDSGAFAGAVRNVAPTATTTYSVVASNPAGAAATVTVTVYVAQSVNYCTGADAITILGWPAGGQSRVNTNGLLNGTESWKLVIPFNFSPPLNINHTGYFSIAEVPGQPVTGRDVTVSKNSCDFTSGNYLYNGIGGGTTAYIPFTVNNPGGYQATGAKFNAQSGDTIYIHVRNANSGVPSCSAVSCDVFMDFAAPNRY